ncbi:MAG: transposase [Acidobacteria bacterium]|nr:transposase [Acidobacteriota bacterium]
MGRPTRIKGKGLTFHITSRTNGKKLCFQAKRDRKMFCKILQRILFKYGLILYSFTLMSNHFHMLIHILNDADLSQALCEFKVQYAKYYNRRYGLCGHFWGERFLSTIVQDDRHALACLRYIDRNPVKAGLVSRPDDWTFGTYSSYAYGHPHELLPVRLHPAYMGLSHSEITRRAKYKEFIRVFDAEMENLHGRLSRMRIFGENDFRENLLRRFRAA